LEAHNLNLTSDDSQAVVFISGNNLAYIFFQNTIIDNIQYVKDTQYIFQKVSPGIYIEAPGSELIMDNLNINRIYNKLALSPLYLNLDSILI
jgi:hypothetical protein